MSSVHLPGTDSTEQASIPRAMAATLGAGTAPRPQARSIAGVYVEASGQAQSVYTAMEQGLLPAGLGLALLEAQAATGGLVDPAQGQLLPVSEALQQGLVGLELKEKLLAAERAATGYPDPYGGEKLSLFQAIGKEVVDRALGQSWLEAQLATGGLVDPARGVRVAPEQACQQGLLDRETWHKLSELEPGTGTLQFLDPNTLERLTYYQLLERCVRAPSSGLAMLPLKITFRSVGGAVSAAELLEVGILDEEAVRGLQEGRLAAADVGARAEVRRYLEGTGSVAGVVLLPEGHKKSFFQAAAEHLLPMGTALPLLEAQAATHTLADPTTGQRLWVDEAVRAGLVSPELHEQLLVAEQAVTGYHDPFSGSQIPLFQAMKKGLVDRPLALRLLDAQLTTGGLVCPARRLRLPLEAALHCGCLDEDTQRQLSGAGGFSDPGTHGGLRYEQLLARCVTDPDTGLAFLPLSGGPREQQPQGPPFIMHGTRQALSSATTTISVGKFRGRPVSLWELLFSEAISAERRAMLAQQHQKGTLSVEELAAELSATLEQAAATAKVTFSGLRDTVTPGELLEAEIIDQDLYEQLEHGQTTAQDVSSLASVQKYLQGTGCIAGLLLPGSQERLSIYEARRKGLLRPGTALILLEAQAATGFIIDPKENKAHSVEEALRAGVIGPDVYAKLLSAERAVTGYTDPYTGQPISLFQAMQKGLIVQEHGIRLLEAQIATGGIIDPVHSHRVPVDVAYRRGYFDQMLNMILLDPSDDTKGFFDPNTHENLTYLQLLERCVEDAETGLYLLPLGSTQCPLVDSATRQAFQNLLLSVKYGRLQGQRVSAWELINSEYFSETRRRQLLHQYRRREVMLGQVAQLLEAETQRQADVTLPALRGRVTAHQLLEARIIDQQLLDQVLAGTVSPEALLLMDSVRRYLRGLGAVGGVRLLPSGQRLSLYQAMRQKLLGPSVALALLEAQAATGTIVDPDSLESLSVDEAVRRGVVGPELYGRLKRAEGAITGFRDPFSGTQVSLFQAMKKGLIPWDQTARLLEAQVATGGVIDPMGHHHLPMPVAIQRGFVDQEMETALSSSSETFPTPDSQGRTSYARLLEQCPRDETSGSHLLPLPESAPALPTEEQVQKSLQAMPGTEDGTSLWDLLSSCHFTEEQRRALLEDVQEGRTAVPQLLASVQTWIQETKLLAQARVTVPGPRGEVPAVWLLDAGIIPQETLKALAQGTQSPTQVAEQPAVKACLWGTGCVAGVLLQHSGAKASIAQAMRDGLLPAGLGQRLLEAQVASGSLVDPLTNQRLSVEDAIKVGLVGRELSEQLGQAERAVAGYPDPYSGGSLSLWQAMEKGLVPQNEGFPLLQVQLATGGVVEPVHGVHLPQAAACRLGLLDTQTSRALTAADEDNKFFFDPSAQDQVTYQELRERCVHDPETGLLLLPLTSDTALEVDDHTAVALRAMKVPVSTGRLQGCSVSLWDLLRSEYIGADKRQELVALCRSGRAAALREVVSAVTALVEAAERQPLQATFRGLRKQVSARDLFTAQLISKKTLDELSQGVTTVTEVAEMDSVRRSLEGGNFIAGVLVQGTQERMSIPEALRRHILRPGTALVLLEAQAATGFIIDPVENRKLTVEEAFKAGMFGKETYVKLLSAERAVTGYTDPYTGQQISLFQAMQKDLIVREHGIRLLEAQIATGGVIDPVHSHRVPVDVAYRRGYFDEEMNRVLADPSDDTKGFFDPNTHENLTYVQLLRRCVRDPDTGLYMLQLAGRGSAVHQLSEELRCALREARVTPGSGALRGQSVSVWELLFYREVCEGRRQDLLSRYRAGTLTVEELGATLISLLAQAEAEAGAGSPPPDPREALRAATMEVKVGRLRGRAVPVWDVLASGYVSGAAREELLAQFGSGTLALPALTRRLTAIIEEAEETPGGGQERQDASRGPRDPGPAGQGDGDSGRSPDKAEAARRQERTLRGATMEVQHGQFQGRPVSVWDVLFSSYLSEARRDELLAQHAAGALSLPDLVAVLTRIVEEAEERLRKVSFRGLRRQVSASELHTSGILGPDTLRALAQGTKTLQEVTEMDSVKRYLEGTSCIAGVLVPAKDEPGRQEKMSIYQAMWKGVLRPGTALVLLEAQAATGFVIDPVRNLRLSVEEAVAAGVVGGEIQEKLLSAERAVTGYTDPYTGQQISLFQAMQKDLIVREHGIRLLEAQIATGGIIDPVHSHRVPVDVAYQRGYFDEEMNHVLADPSDDTKGFFDPNTHENLTYLQLLERCVEDPETGLYLLQIVKKGDTYVYIDEAMRHMLLSRTAKMRVGRFADQVVSFWDLLSSPYFTEDRKRELIQAYGTQSGGLEKLLEIITTTIEETETQNQGIKVAAIRGEVTAAELFNSGIIDQKTLHMLRAGRTGGQVLSTLEELKPYLEGSGCIAGVIVPSTMEVVSLHEASRKELIPLAFATWLLEAQAATGFLLDPCTHQRLSVDEAVVVGLVSEELCERLLKAERAATGYRDPATGDTIPLFQAMQKQLVGKAEALRLLEVQVATGGVIDPRHHHRLPLETAYRRGCLHKDTYALISDQKHMRKRFVDPNTQEKVSYQELQHRCHRQEDTGWLLFPVAKDARDSQYVDEETLRALEAEQVEITVGRFRGQKPTLWTLLNSEYVTEEKKFQLVRMYRLDTNRALQKVAQLILDTIETQEKDSKQLWFQGIRRQVTASELLSSHVITEEMLQDLETGRSTVQQLRKDKHVKRYLEGTSCIAGVLVPAKDEPGRQEKMSIYQAMWKGVLRPGTALVLLEAQAATGFVIDPVRNLRLSVEEAVAAGVVGGEIQEKLLSAERAVTGYTDPYTGQQISLFQAMQKDLIVREHGIRLLEAQIATGGVIDPVHSHRVPVDVAYQRGYFDEEMNRILADPSDDTKGFFDPSTHENLTYLQLLQRATLDPETGLLFLSVSLQ
ncbi:epiplakin isoform X1 [Cebus imitator]|uniref:epiplakin isoform X1 n=1 Tax=Cebus imitator TaxID=2715852 RepID=UPI00080A74B9|nr:epiplakin isoform X1 [Cebus imitator]